MEEELVIRVQLLWHEFNLQTELDKGQRDLEETHLRIRHGVEWDLRNGRAVLGGS
jgi:hypothetical protein